MKHLENKVVVITGGTRGIGRAISIALAESGAEVYALYAKSRKNAETLEKEASANGFKVTAIRGDLSHEQSYRQTVQQLDELCDRVDVLVHSAASGVHKKAMELSERHLKWTFEINLHR